MSIDNKEFQIEEARASLDRILEFFPKTESKALFILSINSATVALIAFNIAWVLEALWLLAIVLPWALFSALSFIEVYRAIYPHLSGPAKSKIYFGTIAKMKNNEFEVEFKSTSLDEWIKDYAEQIWINSKILELKFRRTERAFVFAAIALIFTFAYLASGTLSLGHTPIFNP
nr:Pycsar system effector family protein [Nitrosomonas nitrosa]